MKLAFVLFTFVASSHCFAMGHKPPVPEVDGKYTVLSQKYCLLGKCVVLNPGDQGMTKMVTLTKKESGTGAAVIYIQYDSDPIERATELKSESSHVVEDPATSPMHMGIDETLESVLTLKDTGFEYRSKHTEYAVWPSGRKDLMTRFSVDIDFLRDDSGYHLNRKNLDTAHTIPLTERIEMTLKRCPDC